MTEQELQEKERAVRAGVLSRLGESITEDDVNEATGWAHVYAMLPVAEVHEPVA